MLKLESLKEKKSLKRKKERERERKKITNHHAYVMQVPALR